MVGQDGIESMTVAVPGYEYRHLLVGKSPLKGLAATPPWGPGKAVAVKCTQYFLELGNLKVPVSLKAVVRKTVTGS